MLSPSDAVIKQIAESASNDQAQPSEFQHGVDIRPYARTVLASFGSRASPYRDLALRQISSKDGFGTGAAQVLAATDPAALPRVVELFKSTLSTVPSGSAIPSQRKSGFTNWRGRSTSPAMQVALNLVGFMK